MADDAPGREPAADDASARTPMTDDASARTPMTDDASAREPAADDAAGGEFAADDAAGGEFVAGDTAGHTSVPHLRWWLAATVVGQLLVLYVPRGVAPPSSLPGADKVVHTVVFLLPVLLALLSGFAVRAVLTVSAVHAVLSEVVQFSILPARSGDPWDVAADLLGVLCGWLVWTAISGRPSRSGRA
ncbi:MAG: VanZ family protein [Dermatophilaceae bacterium]